MSGTGENAFEILAAKDRKAPKVEKSEGNETSAAPVAEAGDIKTSTIEGEDSSWTVQSSVKTRRLVPQFSLSRQDLGSENSRNKPVAPQDQLKKKVIRFTKDEMLALRKPSKILSNMSEMLEVVSLTTLDPVCFDKLEPEDVVRIWNMETNRNNTNRDMGGRGRGRTGRGGRGSGDDHHHNQSGAVSGLTDAPVVSASDWSRGQAKAGPWDGGAGAAGTFELADFAAAALKFRSEMADMKLADGAETGHAGEDTMERLMREQTEAHLQVDDEDEDAMPDWAADGDSTGNDTDIFGLKSQQKQQKQQQPLAKRSLLLETLNVKASAAVDSTSFKPERAVVGVELSLHPSVVDTLLQSGSASRRQQPPQQAALLPEPVIAEWFYTDPQGQVQGPFSQENMQLWHEAGYFSRELPIKLRSWLAFHPFCLVFPSETALRAFSGLPHEPRPLFPPMPALMASHSNSLLEQQMRMEQQQQTYLREQQNQIDQQRQAAEHKRLQELHAYQREQEEAARQLSLQQQQQQRNLRPAISGPPPLVPAVGDSKQSVLKSEVTATTAPVPALDSLRKIRISTNINELNAGSAAAGAGSSPAKRSAVESEPRKKTSGPSGPPPLMVQDGGKVKDKASSASSSSAAAPWAGDASSGVGSTASSKESMVEIQRAEKERAERERMVRDAEARQQQIIKGKGWAESGAAAGAAKLVTASLSDIQQEEESRQQQREKQRSAGAQQAAPLTMSSQLKSLLGVRTSGLPAGPASPAAKQWGGSAAPNSAATQDSSNGKSLRDIMQQEEKQAPERNAAAPSGSKRQQQPLSWAAKASTGVNASNLAPVPLQQHAAGKDRSSLSSDQQQQQQPKVSSATAKSATANVNNSKISSSSSGNDFGGKGTSREMSEWCSAQLRKITGSTDDLSALVDFCMSLESASEIREYLSQYLGSSPQLTNFATDFIKVKEGGKKALLIDSSAPAVAVANKKKVKPQPSAGK